MSLLKRIGGGDGLGQPGPAVPQRAAAAPPPAPPPPSTSTLTGRMPQPPIGSAAGRFASAAPPPSEDLVRRSPVPAGRDNYMDLKNRVQSRLIAELDPKLDLSRADEVRRQVEEIYNSILETESITLSRVERARLF